jgi:hypothetical protein
MYGMNDVFILDCHLENDICNYFINKCNMQNSDIIIATLKQYIDIFEIFTNNILIYIHGGGDGYMKYLHPLIDVKKFKYNYPIIFYDNYWGSCVNIYQKYTIKDENLIFPYFTVCDSLFELSLKCELYNKKNYKCFYIRKNKYDLKFIHDNKCVDLQHFSLEKCLKILNQTKFIYLYDVHSLYINFAILLRNNIIIPKYKNMNKKEFIDFYKKDSNRKNDIFFYLFDKYLHYIEDENQIIEYINIEETHDYLFDGLINKFHTTKFNSYKHMNKNTIDRLIYLLNNLNDDKYLRTNMIE